MSDRINLVLILRLVVQSPGKLVHGSVLDTDGRTVGQFTDWEALLQLVKAQVNRPR